MDTGVSVSVGVSDCKEVMKKAIEKWLFVESDREARY